MIKRYRRALNAVLSLKLRDDLFTLAQTRENCLMEFFDIKNKDGHWSDLDLNKVDPLFCLYVADNRLKSLYDAIIPSRDVIPNQRPLPRLMLSAMPIMDEKYRCSVSLIELDEKFSSLDGRTLKENLVPPKDNADLYAYELAGMYGSADKMAKRLTRYFDTGVNWDDSKTFIFGADLPMPKPKKR